MANPEHLAILEQGVEVWNRWRKENRSERPDLLGVNLSDNDLSGINLNEANLKLVNLAWANLSHSDLSWADLKNAKLRGADLSSADLSWADLSRAELKDAKLINAILEGTILRQVVLDGVDFFESVLLATVFTDCDLGSSKNLQKTSSLGPSSLGLDTIIKSKGQIPESFLRGCGVPDEFIAYIPSLIPQPVQYYSCFISHSRLDKDFCERLYNDLRKAHVRTWYFPEDAKWGRSLWGEVDRTINLYDKLVLVCSENSLQSAPVLHEINRALNREDKEGKNILFPIVIDDYLLEKWEHSRKHEVLARIVGSFQGWRTSIMKYNQPFKRLLDALNADE